MNALTNARTPKIVAAEINSIIRQTEIIVLTNSLQVGRLLLEAKEMLPHGEFGDWCRNEIGYSKTKANELMQLFNEYGANQGALFGSIAKSPTYELLTKSQAMALLPVPEAEREQFIEEHNATELTVRQLKEEVKKYKEQAEALTLQNENFAKESEGLESSLESTRHALTLSENRTAELEKAMKDATELNKEATAKIAEAAAAKKALNAANNTLKVAEDKYTEAMKELANVKAELQEAKEELAKPVTVEVQTVEKVVEVEKVPEAVQAELEALKQREAEATLKAANMAVVGRAKDSLKRLQDDFNTFMELLNSVKDEKLHGALHGAAEKTLEAMNSMLEY